MSTQNALIMAHSRRWPLMIDPQRQANTWIRKMDHGTLTVVNAGDSDVMRKLEGAHAIDVAHT